jgi:AIPR protein
MPEVANRHGSKRYRPSDGILDQRAADGLPSHRGDEVFEFLVFEQVLKDYDLSREELESGWVDGRDDGGVDGFFTIVNGHLLRDVDVFAWPKRNATLEVVIVTAKHHATFQQAPLNSMVATLPELLDLGRDKTRLDGSYSDILLKARSLFHLAYRRLASISPTLSFRFVYASRGDPANVADNVRARANQVVAVTDALFSSSSATFDFVGATELVTLYRRTKTFSLALPFVEYLSRSGDSYVLVVRLTDYSSFVTDENGNLRRYLFDSNVRDYLGENRVNEDIRLSLEDSRGPEFWWLNNGVTILATGATILGKVVQLQDVQIVNGLQTTESIFRHFNGGAQESAESGLLVKVVVSTDAAVRDQIIRATNNQSTVEGQSLHATDKIQRDIEDFLDRHEWFYERRKNYYKNIGKPAVRFVTPMYITAGFVALVLRNPSLAGTLRSRFMRNPEAYELVFSEKTPLGVWPVIVEVIKRSEGFLERFRGPKGSKGERFLARNRNLLGLIAVARTLGTFSYSVDDLIAIDLSILTERFLQETWALIEEVGRTEYADSEARPKSYAYHCCVAAAERFGLDGVRQIGRRNFPTQPETTTPVVVEESFTQQVNENLPEQPWKPGMPQQIAQLMNVKRSKVAAAINTLIARGERLKQKDGVVYDRDGRVVAVDPERADRSKLAAESKTETN